MSNVHSEIIESKRKSWLSDTINNLINDIKLTEELLAKRITNQNAELARLNTVNKPTHNAQKEALEELKGRLNSARKAKLQFRGEEQNHIIKILENSVRIKKEEVETEEARIRNMPRIIKNVYYGTSIKSLTESLSQKKLQLEALQEEYARRYGERFVSVAEAPAAPPKTGILSWFGLGGRRHRRCKTVRRVRRSKKTVRKHSRR